MKSNIYGISGMSSYFPSNRVDLNEWSTWNSQPYEKIESVVGTGFRLPSPSEDVYTLAANACLKLIESYNIDTDKIGFIGLGTESSLDNALGTIIIKGLLNDALKKSGYKEINRACEVPEYKHACLAGMYALKGGLRYLLSEGKEKCAIIVASDIAKYAIGSSGEATQGSGAIAVLIEKNPKLLDINISNGVSSSAYRHIDFRKPLKSQVALRVDTDLAQVNGKFSSLCYLDEVKEAINIYEEKNSINKNQILLETDKFFFHRPFKRMPENALTYIYLLSILSDSRELENQCNLAGLDFNELIKEQSTSIDFFRLILEKSINNNIQPITNKLISFLRNGNLKNFIKNKLWSSNNALNEIGNIYSGSVFACIASALEESQRKQLDIANENWLAVGYGSGNAADILPMRVSKSWAHNADKINFSSSLDQFKNLKEEEYVKLHELKYNLDFRPPKKGFKINIFGNECAEAYTDKDIASYNFLR